MKLPPMLSPTQLLVAGCLLLASTATKAEENVLVDFKVQVDSSNSEKIDTFRVEVIPDWAPLGAARFLELVDTTEPEPFFQEMRFFRVLDDFIAQFGISGNPDVAAVWRDKTLRDDPVTVSNTKGTLTFAMRGEDTRTTQIFINFADNSNLDDQGFSPFAKIVDGMDVVLKFYSGYGEGAPRGNGPDQGRIQSEGNAYLEKDFPLLSKIVSAERVPVEEAQAQAQASGGGEGQETTSTTSSGSNEGLESSSSSSAAGTTNNFRFGWGMGGELLLAASAALLL